MWSRLATVSALVLAGMSIVAGAAYATHPSMPGTELDKATVTVRVSGSVADNARDVKFSVGRHR